MHKRIIHLNSVDVNSGVLQSSQVTNDDDQIWKKARFVNITFKHILRN